MAWKSTCRDVFYSDFFCISLSILQLYCSVDNITLVSCYYDRCFGRYILPQFEVPCLHFLKWIKVSHIVHEQSTYQYVLSYCHTLLTWCSQVIVLSESMILLLAGSVPNVQFDSPLANCNFLVKKASIYRTHLLFIKCVVDETEGDRYLTNTSYRNDELTDSHRFDIWEVASARINHVINITQDLFRFAKFQRSSLKLAMLHLSIFLHSIATYLLQVPLSSEHHLSCRPLWL